jgi:dimethylamine/trimethylamine dehydrogenase
MVCTQNATAGEEYRRGWHPEKFHPAGNRDKSVLVIGAGPAGMECAMVLGKREMSAVHLVEADSEIGGCVNWISQLGHSDGRENLFRGSARGLGEWGRIVNYRQIQLDKLRNVEVHLKSRLSTEDVLEYGAEIVIVATGCHFRNGWPQRRDACPDRGSRHLTGVAADARRGGRRGQAHR